MSPKGSYYYPVNDVEDETIISRSRFICYLGRCTSVATAKDFIEQVRSRHPEARHHCYAFIADSPSNCQAYGFSDDGEPGGTAGRPMMAVLQGSGLGQICAVVVRYFGGIKLGTGGLQRAYGGSVRQALTFIETAISIPVSQYRIECNYADSAQLSRFFEQCQAQISDQIFAQQVCVHVSVPDHQIERLQQMIVTFSGGQLKLEKID